MDLSVAADVLVREREREGEEQRASEIYAIS